MRIGLSRWLMVLFLLAPVARAQDLPPTGGRVPTVTRLVKVMTELEDLWADAVAHGDKARLEHLLAEDYELRLAEQPGAPVPRAEYVEAATKWRAPQLIVKQMAVRSIGDLAVVSFLASPSGIGGAEGGFFIVDVWRQNGNEWKALARYSGAGVDWNGESGGPMRPLAAPPTTAAPKP